MEVALLIGWYLIAPNTEWAFYIFAVGRSICRSGRIRRALTEYGIPRPEVTLLQGWAQQSEPRESRLQQSYRLGTRTGGFRRGFFARRA